MSRWAEEILPCSEIDLAFYIFVVTMIFVKIGLSGGSRAARKAFCTMVVGPRCATGNSGVFLPRITRIPQIRGAACSAFELLGSGETPPTLATSSESIFITIDDGDLDGSFGLIRVSGDMNGRRLQAQWHLL